LFNLVEKLTFMEYFLHCGNCYLHVNSGNSILFQFNLEIFQLKTMQHMKAFMG
jgi:hypothetical protein